MEWGQKSTSEVRCQPLGFPPDCAHTRLYLCLLLLWFCFFHAHDRERERLEYQPSPTQPGLSSATGALVTWNSCVRLLCPALQFPSRNRSAMQPTVQNTQFQHWLSCCVCLPFLKAGVSLPVPSWAPPSSRSHSGGDDEDKGGVSWWCMLYHPACSFFFASFLPALFLFTFFLTLFLQNTCDLLPPQVFESQKKGRNVRIWQVSNQLFYCITPSPSHLSPFFSFPFKFL